jgi:hypothetical protein
MSKQPLDKLPVDRHDQLAAEQVPQVKVVQPAVPGEESIFAGVPVFGTGRIAVRFPSTKEGNERWYVSFSLSQFREFSQMLAEAFAVADFGAAAGVPVTDAYTEAKCHYSENLLQGLNSIEYYQADPAYVLEIRGWKCESCGLIVSEDSRKKEKIGGKTPSSVAKAKCPKCKKKFGDNPLYGLKEPAGGAAASMG